jgi:hypothetical protein
MQEREREREKSQDTGRKKLFFIYENSWYVKNVDLDFGVPV